LTMIVFGFAALFVGCNHNERGPAIGQQDAFRNQINESVPVKQWGYKIADVRISDDGQKALVVFDLPGKTNGINEVTLTNDGFRKYRGRVYNESIRDAATREYNAASAARQSNIT